MSEILGKDISKWVEEYPKIETLINTEETDWFNPQTKSAQEGLEEVGLTSADIEDARDRLKRWAPYLAEVFPEAKRTAGILESPLACVPDFKAELEKHYGIEIPGQLWAKLDSHLPISGSIKARGGVYEVLKHAEEIALAAGLITLEDDYRKLNTKEAKELFGKYKVAVGSTGNLGLSIGIMSAQLGFQAFVHMSSDARQWKKDKLRSHGVTVVEYESDYSVAVAEGRKQSESDETMYFVDDENSTSLFLGYAVSGARLAGQFKAYDVRVDEDHPLIVYLPCGVGGGPGGVAFGLKSVFGDNVRCIFAEPTHCPSMMLGVMTGEHDNVAVQDFGIDNITAADGLACGRPSAFVGRHMQYLIDGYYTVEDPQMYRLVALLAGTENLRIEPSSATAFAGPAHLISDSARQYREHSGLTDERLANAIHLGWVTGGSMVPAAEMDSYIAKGHSYL
ncbi:MULTISPECIES: D-serine ammonia-lyase [Propionimicrobium]|uniref:D-serine ammonia-lyase n=1 Tax=Propionimicrobium TaxID=203133 RepID=UPI0003D798B0|nr:MULTISPECIES: D-serine ammonia-lyase [Propionimicrobium]ETJ98625.1 D-serine ammonia-lyase [Propionimicrobium sp. BV2F7]